MRLSTVIAMTSLATFTIPALAAGMAEESMLVPPANMEKKSPWMIRARVIDIAPNESSHTIPMVGGKVTNISNEVVPEVDINYFFNDYLSAELILATARHSVTATNTALGKIDLGKVGVLPPTLTAVFHMLPGKLVNPYVGAGVNYTYFYSPSSGSVASSVSYSNSFGPAAQVGVDIALNEHWYLNADIKKVYIKTDAKVKALGLTMKTDVKINPLIYGVGIGYRF